MGEIVAPLRSKHCPATAAADGAAEYHLRAGADGQARSAGQGAAVGDRQCAVADRRAAGVTVDARERQLPTADLRQAAAENAAVEVEKT